MKANKRVQHPLPPLLLILLALGMGPLNAAESERSGTPITTVAVEVRTMAKITTVQGVLESSAMPQLSAKIAGEVVSVMVDEGERVRKGQQLASIDNEPFEIALKKVEAQIARLEILLQNQQRKLQRQLSLNAQSLNSETQLDEAQTEVSLTQSELVSAQVQLREARYLLTHTRIISPVSGTIQTRTIVTGDYVTPGTGLFQIVADGSQRVRLYLPQWVSGQIRRGAMATVHYGSQQAAAQIVQLRPMLQSSNRSLHALATLQQPQPWLVGSALTAELVLEQHPQVMAVPQQSIVQRPAGAVLYQIEGDRALERRVTMGIEQQGMVEISGVEAGITVALDGAPYLTDGALVEVRN